MASISRVVEPRRSGIHIRHAQRHGKVGMREINPAGAIAPGHFGWPRRSDAMERLARGHQHAVGSGIFDGPGRATIETAREQVLLGALAVNVMTLGAQVLVIAATEADQDFVAPRPKPVVGRPAAEAPWLRVNLHVPERGSAGCFDVGGCPSLRVLGIPGLIKRFGRRLRRRRRGQ